MSHRPLESRKTLSARYNVSISTIRRWEKLGVIQPAMVLGALVRFDPQETDLRLADRTPTMVPEKPVSV